ncbi:MAG: hypothetical protein GY793_11215 [Proteobacteria bacterium]|nr:hypothetical protein [Pseudomonadota bacterium]
MQIQAAIKGDLNKIIKQKNKRIVKAVNKATRRTVFELRKEMVSQTQRAGLGYGLAKSWQVKIYDKNKDDKFPTGLVYTKSAKIMDGFETGGTRKPLNGKWIAIPSDNVPKAPGRKRYTPKHWPKSFPELYFAKDTKGSAYLVGQTVHKTTSKGKKVIRKTTRKTESEAETVIYFFLVKQTHHVKKLNFAQANKQYQNKMKLYISSELKKTEP